MISPTHAIFYHLPSLTPPISLRQPLKQLIVFLFLGRQFEKIKAEAQEKGDLGLVAESSRSNQRIMFQPASLTAGGVFKKLKEIASMSGNSVSHKLIFSLVETVFADIMFTLFPTLSFNLTSVLSAVRSGMEKKGSIGLMVY